MWVLFAPSSQAWRMSRVISKPFLRFDIQATLSLSLKLSLLFLKWKTSRKHINHVSPNCIISQPKISKNKIIYKKNFAIKRKKQQFRYVFDFNKMLQSAVHVTLFKLSSSCPCNAHSYNWGKNRLIAVYDRFYIQIQKQKTPNSHHIYNNLALSFLRRLHKRKSSRFCLYAASHQPFYYYSLWYDSIFYGSFKIIILRFLALRFCTCRASMLLSSDIYASMQFLLDISSIKFHRIMTYQYFFYLTGR